MSEPTCNCGGTCGPPFTRCGTCGRWEVHTPPGADPEGYCVNEGGEDCLRAALSQSLDVNADWDHFYRELAPVLDAAREFADRYPWQDGPELVPLRAALAALPVPPVERGRAVLQTNGRGLEWPGEGEP